MSLIASDHFRIVVGLGKSGLSVVRHLARRGLPFAVADTRANPPELATLRAQYPQVEVRCGELDAEFLLVSFVENCARFIGIERGRIHHLENIIIISQKVIGEIGLNQLIEGGGLVGIG